MLPPELFIDARVPNVPSRFTTKRGDDFVPIHVCPDRVHRRRCLRRARFTIPSLARVSLAVRRRRRRRRLGALGRRPRLGLSSRERSRRERHRRCVRDHRRFGHRERVVRARVRVARRRNTTRINSEFQLTTPRLRDARRGRVARRTGSRARERRDACRAVRARSALGASRRAVTQCSRSRGYNFYASR